MAPNSSSIFNKPATEAPADNAVLVSKTSAAPTSTPADATSAAAASPSTTTMTASTSVVTSAAGGVDCRQAPASPSDVSATRFSPSVLDNVKLSIRKSCLKRPSPTSPIAAETPKPVACEPSRPVQKNRRRCWECKAKVGLTAVTCRCDYTFCNKHRYAEEHKCTFNFKTAGKRKLEEDNPRIVPSKVARIN